MNDPDQPTRWRQGGSGAPEGFDALAQAQDEARPDDAALGRVIERLSAQVAAPELVAAFRAAQAEAPAGRPRAGDHADAPPPAPHAPLGSLAKLIAGTTLLGVLGLAVVALRSEQGAQPPPPSQPPAEASARVATPPAASTPPAQPPPSADPQPAAAQPAEAAPAGAQLVDSRPRPAPEQDSVTELRLLESAQRLLHADPARALALAEQHRRRFPRGDLAQEREMLAIEALLALGRTSRAVTLARAFEKRYPSSSHLPHLRDLVPAAP